MCRLVNLPCEKAQIYLLHNFKTNKKMEKILMTLLVVFGINAIQAQHEGSLIYKATRKMETPDASEEDKQRMATIMAGMNTAKKKLDFNSEESLFYDVTGDQESRTSDVDASGGEKVMVIKVAKNEDLYYKNFDEKKYINKRDLFGKKFIINEDLVKFNWKMANEQKEIAGYTCMKAVTTNAKEQPVIAWFTASVSMPNGPDQYGGLPGLIIALDENNGERYYELESIDFEAKVIIEKPSKGDKVSQKKYDEIAEQKRKEMQEMYGGNGGMMIINRERNND